MNFPPCDTPEIAVTQDTLLSGRLQLTQPAKGHRAGTDAVLLGAAAPTTSGLIIDVGAGVGTVGLILALRNEAARVVLLERDPVFAALARQNAGRNTLAGRVTVAETDVLATLVRRSAGVRNESADVVVTNPPFYDADSGRRSSDPLKRAAHVIEGTLTDWVRASMTLLKPGGTFVLIHRPEALAEALPALGRGMGGIHIQPIHAKAASPATRIVLRATKGSRKPLELGPPLVLHDDAGTFTKEAAALHEGRTFLRA